MRAVYHRFHHTGNWRGLNPVEDPWVEPLFQEVQEYLFHALAAEQLRACVPGLFRPPPGLIKRFSSSPDNAAEGAKVDPPRAADHNDGSASSRKGRPRAVKPVRSPTNDSLKSRPARGP